MFGDIVPFIVEIVQDSAVNAAIPYEVQFHNMPPLFVPFFCGCIDMGICLYTSLAVLIPVRLRFTVATTYL